MNNRANLPRTTMPYLLLNAPFARSWVRGLLLTILSLALFFELTIIPFPIVFLVSIIFYVLYPSIRTIIFVTIAGLLLDIVNVSLIGQASLAILITYLILELYKKAFDTRDWRILLLILHLAAFIYSNIFSYETNLLIYLFIFASTWIVIHYFVRDNQFLWLK